MAQEKNQQAAGKAQSKGQLQFAPVFAISESGINLIVASQLRSTSRLTQAAQFDRRWNNKTEIITENSFRHGLR